MTNKWMCLKLEDAFVSPPGALAAEIQPFLSCVFFLHKQDLVYLHTQRGDRLLTSIYNLFIEYYDCPMNMNSFGVSLKCAADDFTN